MAGGSGSRCSIQARMSASRAWTRLMDAAADHLVGEVAEPPLDLVDPGRAGGREVQAEAGVPGQPGLDERGLVGGEVVADQVHVRARRARPCRSWPGTCWNSVARWRRCSWEITVPSAILKAANRLVDAVPDVVVACAARACRASSAAPAGSGPAPGCWNFSSTHSTTALSGGLWYRPTTSTTFSTKSGSVDSLNVSG